jgi:hypothetical protein
MVVLIWSRRLKVIPSLKINNYHDDITIYSEYILDFFAIWLTKFYNAVTLIPRWLLVFVSGTVGSLLISILHKTPKRPAATQSQSKSTPTTSLNPADTNTNAPQSDSESTAKRAGAKQRKPKT